MLHWPVLTSVLASLLAVFTSPPNTASLLATFGHPSATQSDWVSAWMLASIGVQYYLGCRWAFNDVCCIWMDPKSHDAIHHCFYIHPCLWKIKSSDYKNTVFKQTAAESVQAEMGEEALTEQDIPYLIFCCFLSTATAHRKTRILLFVWFVITIYRTVLGRSNNHPLRRLITYCGAEHTHCSLSWSESLLTNGSKQTREYARQDRRM